MRNDELNKLWKEIEFHEGDQKRFFQRIVYVDLLFRAYIGSVGIPSKRFLSIEFPQKENNEFNAFTSPRGFTLTIEEPIVKHRGYEACVLQATTSDQNDVFTILAKDILEELRTQKSTDTYISALKKRIEKWRDFFKNPARRQLPDKTVIGLIGELSFIEQLLNNNIDIASDLWNGPIKAAQDFQGNEVAIEVKTSSANSLDYVYISSEAQLDNVERKFLFLVVFRVERNDRTGITLPALIDKIESMLSEQQKRSFRAKLTCLGYSADDAVLYRKAYTVKEQKRYKIDKGFPRLTRVDIPQGTSDISYKLSLQACEKYGSDLDSILEAIKRYEYGESGRTY